MPVYAYCRIPSHTKTTEGQRREIERYCLANDIREYELFEDTGDATDNPKSKSLYRLLDRLKAGDTLILTEDDLAMPLQPEMEMVFRTCRMFDIRVVTL